MTEARTSTRAAKVRPEEVRGRVGAALERLLEDGARFADLQMQRIADEAGVARSTLYQHYADKTSLLLAVADSATEGIFAAAEVWLDVDRAYARDAITRAIAEVVAERRRHRAIIDALEEATGYDERAAAFWRGRIDGYVQALQARLAADQRAGIVDPGIDPRSAALLIVWGIERAVAQEVAARPVEEDAALVAGLSGTVAVILAL